MLSAISLLLTKTLVTRMGFEPMNAAVKGQCVKPLHQRAIKENKRHFPIFEGLEPSQKNLRYSFFNLIGLLLVSY